MIDKKSILRTLEENNLRVYPISIDIKNLDKLHETTAKFARGDLNTSVIAIQLTNGTEAVKITEGTIINANILRPDNEVIVNDVTVVDGAQGLVVVPLKTQSMNEEGLYHFELNLNYNNTEKIVTPVLTYTVFESLIATIETPSENQISILDKIIQEVGVVKQELLKIIEDSKTTIEQTVTGINTTLSEELLKIRSEIALEIDNKFNASVISINSSITTLDELITNGEVVDNSLKTNLPIAIKTNDEIKKVVVDANTNIDTLVPKIQEGKEVVLDLETKTTSANTTIDSLNANIPIATEKVEEINTNITVATGKIEELNTMIDTSIDKVEELKTIATTATVIKESLETNVPLANTANAELVKNIPIASASVDSLNINIPIVTEKVEEINRILETSVDKVNELTQSVATATTVNIELGTNVVEAGKISASLETNVVEGTRVDSTLKTNLPLADEKTTLLTSKVQEGTVKINELNIANNTATTTKNDLGTLVVTATEKISGLETGVESANTKITELETKTGLANTSISGLDTKIETATTKIDELNTSIESGATKVGELNTAIGTGNVLKSSLEEENTLATSNINSLETKITTGTTLKTELETKIAEGNKVVEDIVNGLGEYPTVTEMNTAITTANEGKVDKVEGKILTTNDFTTEFKTKLENTYTKTEVDNALTNVESPPEIYISKDLVEPTGEEVLWIVDDGVNDGVDIEKIVNDVATLEKEVFTETKKTVTLGKNITKKGFIEDLKILGNTTGGYNSETSTSFPLQSVGQVENGLIVAKTCGKNLIDYKSISSGAKKPFKISRDGEYSLSLIAYNSSEKRMGLFIYNEDGVSLKSVPITGGKTILKFNAIIGKYQFAIYGYDAGATLREPATNIQLEVDISTEYEEYKESVVQVQLPSSMRSVKSSRIDNQDELLLNKSVTQKCNSRKFIGENEGWTVGVVHTNHIVFKITRPSDCAIPTQDVACNKFKNANVYVEDVKGIRFNAGNGQIMVGVDKTELDTQDVTGWKKLLEKWNVEGNPLECIYELKDYIIHEIPQSQNLTTSKTITTLSVETEVQPKEVVGSIADSISSRIDSLVHQINLIEKNKANVTDVYNKTETYSKAEVDAKFSEVGGLITNPRSSTKTTSINGWYEQPNGHLYQYGRIQLSSVATSINVKFTKPYTDTPVLQFTAFKLGFTSSFKITSISNTGFSVELNSGGYHVNWTAIGNENTGVQIALEESIIE